MNKKRIAALALAAALACTAAAPAFGESAGSAAQPQGAAAWLAPLKDEIPPAQVDRLTDRQKVLLCDLANHGFNYGQRSQPDVIYDAMKWRSWRFAEALRKNGLGNWLIVRGVNRNAASGFRAMVLEDPVSGARCFTFCGVDGDQIRDLLDSAATLFLGDSPQRAEALALYEACAKGGDFVFGLSHGGELAAEVFAQYHQQIRQLFLLNSLPINARLLGPEQRAAFVSKKVDAIVVDGDFVSMMGAAPWNIRYVRNNRSLKNFSGGHASSSIEYSEDGSALPESNPYQDFPAQQLVGRLFHRGIGALQEEFEGFPAQVRALAEEFG